MLFSSFSWQQRLNTNTKITIKCDSAITHLPESSLFFFFTFLSFKETNKQTNCNASRAWIFFFFFSFNFSFLQVFKRRKSI